MRSATEIERWLWERVLLTGVCGLSEDLPVEQDEQVQAAGRIFHWAACELPFVGPKGLVELARRHLVMASLARRRVVDVTGHGMDVGDIRAWTGMIRFIEEEGSE